ncbi:cyclin-dependent kinase regulatory subunit [Purpureocillium lavendulum]|uniref:Cyclin-dependent kinase regulatory subunit n=1 Tax=Purpureocillium lavendulum TaxID=1247861 RepID=A0AB34FWA3_9HYPO|nr:cyclin-dependent kinase regulatory subunit [Purpureocillium lavendulum]
MTSTQLPPLNLGDGLRMSLFPSDFRIPDKPDVSTAQAVKGPAAAYVELDGLDTERRTPPVEMPAEPEPLKLQAHKTSLQPQPQELPASEPDARQSPSPVPPAQTIPVHPIPALQDAFTESLDEVTSGIIPAKPKLRALTATARRDHLIGQPKDAEPFDKVWRYRPGQKQHELFKLLAQISFGVYLMLKGMANSNAQVISILQGHIDEIDEFLEVTLEDLNQATEDLNGRIEHLKLPLSNVNVFEELLEDRNFRVEILEGNQKIDHVLSRTTIAMAQWDDDIDAGLQCTAAFTSWLNDEADESLRLSRPDVADVIDAMKGNAEGWLNAFDEINDRTQEVNNLVIRLTTVIAEMEKKAGEVSRRTWAMIPPFTAPQLASMSRSPSKLSSIPSASSRQSLARPVQQATPSIRSSSTAQLRPMTVDYTDTETIEFPLPGGIPLLPPRASARHVAKKRSIESHRSNKPSVRSEATPEPSIDKEADRLSSSTEEPESLYVLQPRTYTPQPPEPIPSPMLREAATITVGTASKPRAHAPTASNGTTNGSIGTLPRKQTSIRHRVERKTNLPDAIHIPPRSFTDPPSHRPSSHTTPRTAVSHPFESAYGSDADRRSRRQGSNVGSDVSMSPPVRPQATRSPRSDHQQYYRPVQASPHSPLQQRPHTAAGPRASQFRPQHLRNQPSNLGGMSMLSNVTMATYDDASATSSDQTHSNRTLKKKKSAFGWFKKAFSMDEEEKAAFKARREMSQRDRYYEANSPKFLDGRRIR